MRPAQILFAAAFLAACQSDHPSSQCGPESCAPVICYDPPVEPGRWRENHFGQITPYAGENEVSDSVLGFTTFVNFAGGWLGNGYRREVIVTPYGRQIVADSLVNNIMGRPDPTEAYRPFISREFVELEGRTYLLSDHGVFEYRASTDDFVPRLMFNTWRMSGDSNTDRTVYPLYKDWGNTPAVVGFLVYRHSRWTIVPLEKNLTVAGLVKKFICTSNLPDMACTLVVEFENETNPSATTTRQFTIGDVCAVRHKTTWTSPDRTDDPS